MGMLSGKVALVTGAATGIGSAIAERLAHAGASVVLNHLGGTQVPLAQRLEENLLSQGLVAMAVEADIGIPEELDRLLQAPLDQLGGLDILINNAVVATLKPIADVTLEEYERSFAVNVRAPFFACQFAARHMREGGRIVNISSHTTALLFPRYGLYDATKGALEQISRVLSKEIGARGITVNVVSPGPTDSPEFRTRPPEFIRSLESMTAMGRIARIEEIVNVVEFLVSPAASWVTGQNIRVNGGVV